MKEAVRCARCGEAIGAYEALIVLVDGNPRETSRAAEHDRGDGPQGRCYHAGCFERSGVQPASLQP